MGFRESLPPEIAKVLSADWQARDGRVVPNTTDVVLRDGAVDLEATVLYADLAQSTRLAEQFSRPVVAKVVRAYLLTMTRLVRHHKGEIRSFDGDRVMGVFVGKSKNTRAAKCALRMSWAVSRLLRPAVQNRFPALARKGFTVTHCAGVHCSKLRVVRGGIREHNDLVFVGEAPNVAAALSQQRFDPYRSYITSGVYRRLHETAKFHKKEENRWKPVDVRLKGGTLRCYRSAWVWPP